MGCGLQSEAKTWMLANVRFLSTMHEESLRVGEVRQKEAPMALDLALDPLMHLELRPAETRGRPFVQVQV